MGDDERQAHPEVRAARIAAVAAIIAAVISLGSGIATYVSTQNQIAAEDRLSTSSFVHNQQKEAYSSFLMAEQEMRDIERRYSDLWVYVSVDNKGRERVPYSEFLSQSQFSQFKSLQEKVTATFSRMRQSDALIKIVGSPEAGALSSKIAKAHEGAEYVINSIASENYYFVGTSDSYRVGFDKLERDRELFVSIIRRDLGS
jgi:hypothetical protein